MLRVDAPQSAKTSDAIRGMLFAILLVFYAILAVHFFDQGTFAFTSFGRILADPLFATLSIIVTVVMLPLAIVLPIRAFRASRRTEHIRQSWQSARHERILALTAVLLDQRHDSESRQLAAITLGRLEDPQVTAALEVVERTDADLHVRWAANIGLIIGLRETIAERLAAVSLADAVVEHRLAVIEAIEALEHLRHMHMNERGAGRVDLNSHFEAVVHAAVICQQALHALGMMPPYGPAAAHPPHQTLHPVAGTV